MSELKPFWPPSPPSSTTPSPRPCLRASRKQARFEVHANSAEWVADYEMAKWLI